MMNKPYDIVINGAGIPGMTLALLLAKQTEGQLSIALLEHHALQVSDTPSDKTQAEDFDLRVYALTHASQQLLASIDVWPQADTNQAWPYQYMQVWDSGNAIEQRGEIHFDAAEIGAPSLGTIIESVTLTNNLIAAVKQSSAIDVIETDSLNSIEHETSSLKLTLASGNILQTSLLVGADGAHSLVKQLAGIQDIGWSYHQRALVATVQTEKPHQDTAWQRFLPDGPLAFLPMQDQFCSIVWTLSESRAQQYCEMPEDEFKSMLAESFEHQLGAIQAVGPRASFPLQLSHVRNYVAERIALIADAAHVVHPLAGQGLNLGLQDVAALAEQILNALQANTDIGLRRYLRAYERSRKGDNWLMQGSFDGLNRLFSNEQAFLTHLRNRGLNWINKTPVIRNQFARKAVG